eukprot:1194273-Prorocentrum_minimum.AAC.6
MQLPTCVHVSRFATASGSFSSCCSTDCSHNTPGRPNSSLVSGVPGLRMYFCSTCRGDQSREGRENIPAGGTSHVRGERIYLHRTHASQTNATFTCGAWCSIRANLIVAPNRACDMKKGACQQFDVNWSNQHVRLDSLDTVSVYPLLVFEYDQVEKVYRWRTAAKVEGGRAGKDRQRRHQRLARRLDLPAAKRGALRPHRLVVVQIRHVALATPLALALRLEKRCFRARLIGCRTRRSVAVPSRLRWGIHRPLRNAHFHLLAVQHVAVSRTLVRRPAGDPDASSGGARLSQVPLVCSCFALSTAPSRLPLAAECAVERRSYACPHLGSCVAPLVPNPRPLAYSSPLHPPPRPPPPAGDSSPLRPPPLPPSRPALLGAALAPPRPPLAALCPSSLALAASPL